MLLGFSLADPLSLTQPRPPRPPPPPPLSLLTLSHPHARWFSVLLLTASNVLSDTRILPYVDLLTCYSVSVATVAFLFGFVVFRSEYYGLPVFMLNSALAVCGAYLGIATSISVGGKLFLCFLSPSVALSMVLERYMRIYSTSFLLPCHGSLCFD